MYIKGSKFIIIEYRGLQEHLYNIEELIFIRFKIRSINIRVFIISDIGSKID